MWQIKGISFVTGTGNHMKVWSNIVDSLWSEDTFIHGFSMEITRLWVACCMVVKQNDDHVLCWSRKVPLRREATFPSTARCLWWLRQFQDLTRRLSLSELLIEVGCTCVQRGECVHVYMSACVILCFSKKKKESSTPSVGKARRNVFRMAKKVFWTNVLGSVQISS